MGAASLGAVFDQVALSCGVQVELGALSKQSATIILKALARALFEQDWDTEDESGDEFSDIPFVLDALRDAGAFRCEDPGQLDDHEDCSRYAACQQ